MENLKVIADDFLPVYENENGDRLINARELHEQLVIGKDFTTWIKDKIKKYEFVENQDYFLTFSIVGTLQNVRKHDYWLTIDAGKELAMVQNNEMGRALRKHFIEKEKSLPKTPAEMLLHRAKQMVKEERETANRERQALLLKEVSENVKEYSRWTRVGHNEVYNSIYSILKTQHGIDVKARVENERRELNAEYYQRTGKLYAESTLKQKVNGIDVMVRMECLDKFNSILTGFLTKAKVPTS
ncbi:antA/AntB antirepressor family protein [Sutcliffiella sp. FSL R7-0096]|uniref:antA/AntB antirepressor family protein n=1 Tax=Sutcliffiella sp. FSL R7-0096 TaxID=2921670 RepID=UPI00315AEF51